MTRLLLSAIVAAGFLTSIEAQAPSAASSYNPLFAVSPLPLHYPPFDAITPAHFPPAFDAGMAEQLAEIAAIAGSEEPPTFANTIVAMERSGRNLERATNIFSALVAAHTNPELEKIRADYSAPFAAHSDEINLDARLFARIQVIYDSRDRLGLDAESKRLVERYHTRFVRAGAALPAEQKERLKAINGELAALATAFSQNVLNEVNASAVVVDDAGELEGLSDAQIAAAAAVAETRGLSGKYVLTLLNTTGQPPNSQIRNRDLRRRLHEASVVRGSRGGAYDNLETISKTMRLRAERARLLGYPNHAAYSLEDQTAKTPEAVLAMLGELAPAAVANARREAADLQAMIDREQRDLGRPSFKLEPWDWAYYTEKVRKERFDFDESELKPYLELDNVWEKGVFYAAGKLFGIGFRKRTDLPVYHPDVTVYDVLNEDGTHLGIFISDMYARDSKRGGAWMNSYLSQSELTGFKPVVANHLNIPKPPEGEPTLLTWDEVITAFHEFGHALHGLFSDVKYPFFSGTSVPRDFVEYPSQVFEMWASWPSVLENYARHYKTGEAMPRELLDKVLAASRFNQGFATTEYLSAAMLDQRWHLLPPGEVPAAVGVMAFEAAALAEDGFDFPAVPPRYRTPYFSHIMGGYSAGYYSYIWSEVLDAHSVEWFRRNGGLDRKAGEHFRRTILSKGGSVDAMELYSAFAGEGPKIEPLLEKRGLSPVKKERGN